MKKVAVDVCLSPRMPDALNSMYGLHGFEFIYVRDLGGGPDAAWADVFKRFGGELVLSGDAKIATRPHEAVAFIDNGFKSFFPDGRHWYKLTIQMQFSYIIHQWGLLMPHLDRVDPGTCWRMPLAYRNDSLILERTMTLKALEIPKAVLDEQRKRRPA